MLKDLLVVVNHYDGRLVENIKKISDPRHQSYITYPMEVIIITRLLAYCCHIQSMAEMNDDFNSDSVIKNVALICGTELENLPHGDTINDLFCRLDINGLRNLLTESIKRMIKSRFFEKYRYASEYYQLVIDGTQLYSFNQDHIEKSLTRTYEDGSKTYHTQSLTAYFVIGDNLIIPVDFEIMENEKENTTKQDCELKASKRLLKRVKDNYPRLKIFLSADALYACEPIISICEKNKWHYIIRSKEGRIAALYEEFEEMKKGNYIEYQCNKTVKNSEIVNLQEYYYVNDMDYEGYALSMMEMKETKQNKVTSFMFITDIVIDEKNVKELCRIGRKRWKIENKGFNDEKNHGYGMTHAYSYHENAVKCHYMLLLMAHMFMQLLEHYLKTKGLPEKIKTIGKEIKEALRTALLNAKEMVEILKVIQIRQEISY